MNQTIKNPTTLQSSEVGSQVFTTNQSMANDNKTLSVYASLSSTEPEGSMSLHDLLESIVITGPSVGDKENAKAITPFRADGKKKEHAEAAQFAALVVDHDDDNKTKDELAALYDAYGLAYFAFTSSYHQQRDKKGVTANRWKVVIPYQQPVGFELHVRLASGCAVLHRADKAQARVTQVFYAPNILHKGAPFEYIDNTHQPRLNLGNDDGVLHPFVLDCYRALEKHDAEQKAQAEAARPKPRQNLDPSQGSIIELAKQAFTVEQVLKDNGYRKRGKKFISPNSTSGMAGVIVLPDGRLYSHHGDSDPLSALNHNGHALDVVDVICALEYGGNFSRTIHELAKELDPEGQKQRQVAHAIEKAKQETAEAFAGALESESPEDTEHDPLPVDATSVQLERPPGLAGEICAYLQKTARRPIPLIYPVVALHALSLVAGPRKGLGGGKLNLLTLAIAPTAAGKEHGQGWLAETATKLKLGRHVVGNIASDVDMIRNLVEGDGRCCYRIDEIHGMFKATTSKNASTYESKIPELILTLATATVYLFNGNHRRQFTKEIDADIDQLEKKLTKLENAKTPTPSDAKTPEALEQILAALRVKRERIEEGWPFPMVSIMGHSTPGNLDSLVNQENLGSGLIGRCLVIRCAEERERLQQPQAESYFDDVSIINRLHNINSSTSTSKAISVTAEAQTLLDRIQDYYEQDQRLNAPILGAIYARAMEQVSKVASLLALESGELTPEHVTYAFVLVARSIDDVAYLLQKDTANHKDASPAEILELARTEIKRKLKGKVSGMTPSALKQSVLRCSVKLQQQVKSHSLLKQAQDEPDLYEQIINRMVELGEVELKSDGRRGRYFSRAWG